MNATRVLVAQHRAIDSLFDEVELETRRRARASAASRLAEELIAHMAAEEAVFYPAIARALGGSKADERSQDDHLLLRVELRRLLETSVTDHAFRERVHLLRGIFDRHVADEESKLFPKVLALVPAEQLDLLGAEVLASRPPVWIVSPEGRTLVHAGDVWALRSSVSLPAPPPPPRES